MTETCPKCGLLKISRFNYSCGSVLGEAFGEFLQSSECNIRESKLKMIELQEDKERIDWLEINCCDILNLVQPGNKPNKWSIKTSIPRQSEPLREAIDKLRKKND